VRIAALANVRAISTRYNHTLALDTGGHVFGFGPEGFGAIGPQIGNDGVRAIAPTTLRNVRQVAAGEQHSLALLADGTVMAWGSNAAGQLGMANSLTVRDTPAAVPGLSDVVAVAASSFTSFALRRDGSVWSWGEATVLGRIGPARDSSPIPGLNGITAISAGLYTAFAVDAQGAAFGWGDNAGGRVGVASIASLVAAPLALPGLSTSAQISGGERLGLGLTRAGHVFAWGSNANNQLDGTPRADTNVPIDIGFER